MHVKLQIIMHSKNFQDQDLSFQYLENTKVTGQQ